LDPSNTRNIIGEKVIEIDPLEEKERKYRGAI